MIVRMNVASKPMSVAELIVGGQEPSMHYELIDGVTVAMSPPDLAHAHLVQSIGTLLQRELPAPGPPAFAGRVGVGRPGRDRLPSDCDPGSRGHAAAP
jgi:Uma2 family endonuclease